MVTTSGRGLSAGAQCSSGDISSGSGQSTVAIHHVTCDGLRSAHASHYSQLIGSLACHVTSHAQGRLS